MNKSDSSARTDDLPYWVEKKLAFIEKCAPNVSDEARELAEEMWRLTTTYATHRVQPAPPAPREEPRAAPLIDIDALCERIRKSAALARAGEPGYTGMLVYHYAELEALVIALASARSALDAKDARIKGLEAAYVADSTMLRSALDEAKRDTERLSAAISECVRTNFNNSEACGTLEMAWLAYSRKSAERLDAARSASPVQEQTPAEPSAEDFR